MPEMLERLSPLDPVKRIAYELGRGRALDNTRSEIEATTIAMARVEALARRHPTTAGESSPDERTLAWCSTG
jgi:hypothetical protein